jgi:hypothetical protein
MAKGEMSFSTGSVDKKKRTFEPFPAGDRELKIIGDSVEIKKPQPSAKNPKPVSYVNFRAVALGTGVDGGKDRSVFHMLFTRMEPGKDGIITPHCVDQLKGLCDALGDDGTFPIIEENGQKVVSPLAIKKYLQKHNGDTLMAHVAIQKGSKDYPNPKNVIKEFLAEGEGEASSEDEDESESEDESEETDDAEESDEEGESEDEGDEDEADDDEPEEDEDELEKAAKAKKAKKLKKGKK